MVKKSSSQPVPEAKDEFHVAIVGGGLVGALTAVYAAQRGWKVSVFESRKDLRREDIAGGRSINLAMSCRALSALEGAKIASLVADCMIPMNGRMIHGANAALLSQPYGKPGECIYSVDRKQLNEQLLSAAEAFPTVNLNFETSVKEHLLDERRLVVQKKDGSVARTEAFGFIFGCDGAYSRCRREIMRRTRMNYSQFYIDHGYVELRIPPTADGQFAMDPHHLHIWPRHTFMLIALPNLDKSFTVTLFVPFAQFEALETNADLISFFKSYFPDATELIGASALCSDFFKHTHGSLISVKCDPYHYQNSCAILGDAAHAMVPFYGQGMNAGFEDVFVLFKMLDKTFLGSAQPPLGGCVTSPLLPSASPTPESPSFRAARSLEKQSVRRVFENSTLHYIPSAEQLSKVLQDYSRVRHPDACAVGDLAMRNYQEMRHLVTTTSYKLRKKVDGFLSWLMPKKWIPLYSMVSFTNIPYSEVVRRDSRQTRIVERTVSLLGIATAGLCIAAFHSLIRGLNLPLFCNPIKLLKRLQ